jgi:hypothetical protein
MSLETVVADVRLAFRQVRRAPLFAILTVGSLALGIGANSAIFSVQRRPGGPAAAAAVPRPFRARDDLER